MTQDRPLANTLTLGVADFERERDVYRRLGWPLALDHDSFAVFELRGALLTLSGADRLARNARATPQPGRRGIRSSIIIAAARPQDVDELTERTRPAGPRAPPRKPVAAKFREGRDATSLTRKATTGRSHT